MSSKRSRTNKQKRRLQLPLKEIVAQINRRNYRRRSQELQDRPVGKEIW